MSLIKDEAQRQLVEASTDYLRWSCSAREYQRAKRVAEQQLDLLEITLAQAMGARAAGDSRSARQQEEWLSMLQEISRDQKLAKIFLPTPITLHR